MAVQQDSNYLSTLNTVFEGLQEYYPRLLADEAIRTQITERAVNAYKDTDDPQDAYIALRDAVERRLEALEQEEAVAAGITFSELEAEIGLLEASALATIERNAVNGYITFRFYDPSGELAGKLTFDGPEEDMVGRTKAVVDHLASAEHTIIYQKEVEEIWDSYDPAVTPGFKI